MFYFGINARRNKVKKTRLKSGFYYIATGANVPIALGYLDYKTKKLGVEKVLEPNGDINSDFERIKDFYRDMVDYHPQNQSEWVIKKNMKQFVLGGARSGKSAYAEQQALASEKKVIYIATATANDEEMQRRIIQHQKQRAKHWSLVEEPLLLADVLMKNDSSKHCILIDCLTLWLSNCLADNTSQKRQNELLEIIPQLNSDLIFVSNEVGQGIVPMGELTRKFVDESGRLHQQLAKLCDQVFFVTAGIAKKLK